MLIQPADYCASKAALINLHDCLRAELRSRYNLPRIRTTLVLPAHIATTLFDQIRMPSSWIWRIFAPRLEMRDVVDGIVSALEADESRVVRLPAYTHSARLLGSGPALVPLWLRDLVQYVGPPLLSSRRARLTCRSRARITVWRGMDHILMPPSVSWQSVLRERNNRYIRYANGPAHKITEANAHWLHVDRGERILRNLPLFCSEKPPHALDKSPSRASPHPLGIVHAEPWGHEPL